MKMKIFLCLFVSLLFTSDPSNGYQPLRDFSSPTSLSIKEFRKRNDFTTSLFAIKNPWKNFRLAENTILNSIIQNPLFTSASQIYSFFWWFPRKNLPFDSPTKLFRNSTSQFLAYSQIPRNLPPIRYIAKGLPDDFFCYGMYGNTLPFGNWDPAGFSQVPLEIVRRFRESEIKHGRLAMLATIGCLVQEVWHPVYPSINGMAVTHMQQLQSLPFVQNHVIKLLGLQTNNDWLLSLIHLDDYRILIYTLAFAEIFLYIKNWSRWRRNEYDDQFQSNIGIGNLRKDYEEGNYGFDPFKLMPIDPEDKKWIVEIELNHGRLAMIAFLGILAQEYFVGVPASQFLRYFFQGKLDQFLLLPEFPRLQPLIDFIRETLQNIAEEASF